MPSKKRKKGWRRGKPTINKKLKQNNDNQVLETPPEGVDGYESGPEASLSEGVEFDRQLTKEIAFQEEKEPLKLTQSENHFERIPLLDTSETNSETEIDGKYDQIIANFAAIVPELDKNGFLDVFQNFFSLILKKKWNFKNISFLLWCDVVNFLFTDNTSCMRYRFDETRKFWWLGRTLFHGRFERLMKGYKNEGLVLQGSPKGYYQCQSNDINFAVPSKINGAPISLPSLKNSGPGIFDESLKICAEEYCNTSCILTFDGKKLAPGLTEDGGDINLIGFEQELSIEKKIEEQKKEMELLDEISNLMSPNVTDISEELQLTEMKSKLLDLLSILPTKTKNIQIEKKKKERMLDVFKEREIKEKGKNFSYVIDSLRCDLQRSDDCYTAALEIIRKVCHMISALNGRLSLCLLSGVLDMSSQENLLQLRNPSEIEDCFGENGIPPELVKQRTPEWHKLRAKARVTGSSLHRAVGGESLKAQREMFDETFCYQKIHEVENQQRQICLAHGNANECNALATFLCTIMPVLYPNYVFYEEGAYFVRMKDGNILWEVSPDGTLRDADENVKAVVEFKCPLPMYRYGHSVYYEVPTRYILQLQAEMKATHSSEALLVCWSEVSTTLFWVPELQNLQELAIEETISVFYAKDKRRPTKFSETSREIRKCLGTSKNVCKFIGKFPSCKGILRPVDSNRDNGIRVFPKVRNKGRWTISSETALETVNAAKLVIKESFELTRQKATEFLPFLLTTTDRHFNPETGSAIPLGYILRGHSLSSQTMRMIANLFHNKCHENGIHVPAKTFDGQWINLVNRDLNGHPLTEMQFAKDFHKGTSKMDKATLLKEFTVHFSSLSAITRITAFEKIRSAIDKMRQEQKLHEHVSQNSETDTPSSVETEEQITEHFHEEGIGHEKTTRKVKKTQMISRHKRKPQMNLQFLFQMNCVAIFLVY